MSSLAAILDEQEGEAVAAASPPLLPRDHLSASSLSMFSRCPDQWRRVYMLGERQRPGAALVWGSADHEAHEVNFRQKIDTHHDVPVADVQDAFAEAFDQRVEQEGGEAEVEWGDDKPGDLKDKGVALVRVYHETVSPGVQPVAVEQPMRLELPDVPVPIVGRLDVITASRVVERKTSARKDTLATKPQWMLQGVLYSMSAGLPVDWHVNAKTKLPAVYTPENTDGLTLAPSGPLVEATVRRVQRAVWQIGAMIDRYGPGEPWPTGAPDYGWACGFCGFRPSCSHWGAGS